MLPLVRAITADLVQLSRDVIERRERLALLSAGRDRLGQGPVQRRARADRRRAGKGQRATAGLRRGAARAGRRAQERARGAGRLSLPDGRPDRLSVLEARRDRSDRTGTSWTPAFAAGNRWSPAASPKASPMPATTSRSMTTRLVPALATCRLTLQNAPFRVPDSVARPGNRRLDAASAGSSASLIDRAYLSRGVPFRRMHAFQIAGSIARGAPRDSAERIDASWHRPQRSWPIWPCSLALGFCFCSSRCWSASSCGRRSRTSKSSKSTNAASRRSAPASCSSICGSTSWRCCSSSSTWKSRSSFPGPRCYGKATHLMDPNLPKVTRRPAS